jgi:hypothetical protein
MTDRPRTDEIDSPNQASEKEKAGGSRENVESGITNRPIAEEQAEQQNLPPRGERKEGSDA